MAILNVGASAPVISGTDIINGNNFSLADCQGKVVCLAFVLYRCHRCARELPRLQNLWKKYKDFNFQMVANLSPNNSTQDQEKAWLAGLSESGITFPVIRDNDSKNFVKYLGYGLIDMPVLFIIDGKQVIQYVHQLLEEEATTGGHILENICNCCTALSPPQLDSIVKKEIHKTEKGEFTHYTLNVINRNSFPAELFKLAPSLPPCGLNKNASRSWVDIFDEKGKRIYGFCALTSTDYLKGIWFAIPKGQALPNKVYITITDRLCNKVYTSNQVLVPK